MKRVGWIVASAAFLSAGAFVWWRFGLEQAAPANADAAVARPSSEVASADGTVTSVAGPPLREAMPVPAPREDYAARLRAAPDYLEFVRSLESAARAGDHAAQFYIFRALDYCDDGYRAYFIRRKGRLTLDEALNRESTRSPYNMDEMRRVHARCQTLMEGDNKDLGRQGDWLWMAVEGGYPLAQAIGSYRQYRNDGAVKREEPQSLLAKAIRSREPEVIWEVGSSPFVSPRSAPDEIDLTHLAWWLAACARGLDCSPQSDLVRQLCRIDTGCQPYESIADLVRRASGNEFPELEARARWINEKIDAGDWEALGF